MELTAMVQPVEMILQVKENVSKKYMIDSVLYWMNEYHVDGFRFDLMGLHDTETMNLIREAINKSEKWKRYYNIWRTMVSWSK